MIIEILMYSTWWDQPPKVKAGFDNKILFQNKVENSADNPMIVKFKINDTDLGNSSSLWVELYDKDSNQTVMEDGKILKDQLLHIKNVNINDVDIGYLKYTAIYSPLYPEPWFQQQQQAGTALPETLTAIDTMGYNGIWTLTFTNPFHIWYLENLP